MTTQSPGRESERKTTAYISGMKRLPLLISVPIAFIFAGCSMGSYAAPQTFASPTIAQKPFGVTRSGVKVDEYTLSSGAGVTASIITWGGIVRSLQIPDRNGKMADIVLGFDELSPYEARHPYFGTLTGRFANRIAKGSFILDGKRYSLAVNNGPNHLHGGLQGFDRTVWKARTLTRPDSASLILSHTSADGDEGYPGELSVEVTYTLSSNNTLRLDYAATTTKATPINLTSHSYFNLAGHSSGDVLDQRIEIHADQIVAVDDTLIPTGELRSVASTAFDFRKPHTIGERISEVPPGYDHTYVLQNSLGFRRAAYAWDPDSGRALEVVTSEPGVQFYTGNFLDGSQRGKQGVAYHKHAGFCLETQHFPDSVNHPSFPSTVLRPGETYQQSTVFKFGVHNY